MMQILERLRLAREERGLDIHALAKRTRVRIHLLEAVEQGRWGDLPRGVYARAVVRAYAEAVGVDPHRVMTEVAPLLPEPEDPLDGMARVRGFERTPAAPAADDSASEPMPEAAGGTIGLAGHARSAAAAAVDAGLLAAVVLPLTAVTAALCGVPVATMVEAAAPAMALIGTLVATLYFLLLGGIGGATPGARLVGQPAAPRAFRGTAEMALRRTRDLVLREGSIVVDVLLPWPGVDREGDKPAMPRSGTRWEERAPAR
ncbi:hypothetical protein BH23ACI1_BH23ACI1_24860 [soil metagenome]